MSNPLHQFACSIENASASNQAISEFASPDHRMTHPASRIVRHYEKHAIAWASDRRNSPWNDKVWHDRFVEALVPGDSVLDLGCGPGFPVAAHLHAHGLKVPVSIRRRQ